MVAVVVDLGLTQVALVEMAVQAEEVAQDKMVLAVLVEVVVLLVVLAMVTQVVALLVMVLELQMHLAVVVVAVLKDLLVAQVAAMAVLVELEPTLMEHIMVQQVQQVVVVVVRVHDKTQDKLTVLVLVVTAEPFIFTIKMKEKLYAVIINDIVEDCWFAETKEEAQQDNPNALIIEITTENSPVFRYHPYPYKIPKE
jgi:hypothetical protein